MLFTCTRSGDRHEHPLLVIFAHGMERNSVRAAIGPHGCGRLPLGAAVLGRCERFRAGRDGLPRTGNALLSGTRRESGRGAATGAGAIRLQDVLVRVWEASEERWRGGARDWCWSTRGAAYAHTERLYMETSHRRSAIPPFLVNASPSATTRQTQRDRARVIEHRGRYLLLPTSACSEEMANRLQTWSKVSHGRN